MRTFGFVACFERNSRRRLPWRVVSELRMVSVMAPAVVVRVRPVLVLRLAMLVLTVLPPHKWSVRSLARVLHCVLLLLARQ